VLAHTGWWLAESLSCPVRVEEQTRLFWFKRARCGTLLQSPGYGTIGARYPGRADKFHYAGGQTRRRRQQCCLPWLRKECNGATQQDAVLLSSRVSRLTIANTALIIAQDPVPIIDLHGPLLQVMLGFQEISLTHHTTPSLDPRHNGPSGV